jgi:hypothetical protein
MRGYPSAAFFVITLLAFWSELTSIFPTFSNIVLTDRFYFAAPWASLGLGDLNQLIAPRLVWGFFAYLLLPTTLVDYSVFDFIH